MVDSLTAISVKPHRCPLHQSILLTQGPIHKIFTKKYWELAILKNIVFLSRPFWIFFASFPWKKVKVYWLARMAQNFDQTKRDNTFWPRPNILTGSVLIFRCTGFLRLAVFVYLGFRVKGSSLELVYSLLDWDSSPFIHLSITFFFNRTIDRKRGLINRSFILYPAQNTN